MLNPIQLHIVAAATKLLSATAIIYFCVSWDGSVRRVL